jgi:hypothetical protein
MPGWSASFLHSLPKESPRFSDKNKEKRHNPCRKYKGDWSAFPLNGVISGRILDLKKILSQEAAGLVEGDLIE